MSNRLAQMRASRGWKKARLLFELRAAAARRNETLPKDESLARRVAVWENQNASVSDFYCELLCDVYSCTPRDLGLVEEFAASPIPKKPVEAPVLARIDDGLVGLLRSNTQNLRMLDRRLGSSAAYDQTVAHVVHLEQLVKFAFPGTHRDSAADELGQAAALAGWQALDGGHLDEAWRHHELAASAAREGGVPSGLAYALGQQAYVLLEMGHVEEAWNAVRTARVRVSGLVPAELVAWLHAAEGEVLAAMGNRDQALRALDAADVQLPSDGGGELPYVMLNAAHLARWRGHCLARLGETSAIDDLSAALATMSDGQYGRAEVSLRVDLALALRARGELGESRDEAERAGALAGRTGSRRQQRRIVELLSA